MNEPNDKPKPCAAVAISPIDAAAAASAAHVGLDAMLAEADGEPCSAIVIVYEAGAMPVMRYYGRTLSRTELVGVLQRLVIGVSTGESP